jgi:hypothetical protein
MPHIEGDSNFYIEDLEGDSNLYVCFDVNLRKVLLYIRLLLSMLS